MECEAKEPDDKYERSNRISCRQDLTPFFEKSDHSINKIHLSEVPQICRREPCQIGIDEAGRGPVLGPMVYGVSYVPLSNQRLLADLGCADSKSLSEEQRDAIFDKICDQHDVMGWAIEAISPNVIANSMYRRTKVSLNQVSTDSAIGLIDRLIEAGVNITEVYVDTVGKPEKYQSRLKEIFPEFKVVVAKKADSIYPIVSAASICAKVSRDHALRAWQFREGPNESKCGSGYPNDPVTKKWLVDNVDRVFGFPHIVRFSWSTAETILTSKAVTVVWEDSEEEKTLSDRRISKYFLNSDPTSNQTKRKKHTFFRERCLSSANGL